MLFSRSVLTDLTRRLTGPATSLRVVAVPVDLDPLDLVRSGSAAFGFSGFFSSPEGRSIGALGSAGRWTASGAGRLLALDAAVGGIAADTPMLVGFAFADDPGRAWDGFAPASAVLPAISIVRDAGESRLLVAVAPGSDATGLLTLLSTLEVSASGVDPGDAEDEVQAVPPAADFLGVVDEAVAAIKAGVLAKVVLARSVSVRRSLPIDAFGLVGRLRDAHPSSWVFGWQEGESAFVGASPELLVARRGGHAHLAPLAGSAPRHPDPDRDRRLGEALLASAKDRAEHEFVIADAMGRLVPLVGDLHRAPTPQLQRFPTVQHLATPISGSTSHRVLELASALHPTAAVGGIPRESALDFIARTEGIDRGWYAGGIGWADAAGDGEIAIGLRCALLRGDTAVAYAGGGIVADSLPAAELEETRLKLRPILDLLT